MSKTSIRVLIVGLNDMHLTIAHLFSTLRKTAPSGKSLNLQTNGLHEVYIDGFDTNNHPARFLQSIYSATMPLVHFMGIFSER